MNERTVSSCPRCGIGRLQSRKITHTLIQDGMLISIQNMPALECDVCDFQDFESEAMWQLDALSGEFNAPETQGRSSTKLPPIDVDSENGDTPTSRLKP